MKTESLSIQDLLVSYLNAHYTDKYVLVIHGGGECSDQEADTLYEELEEYWAKPFMPIAVYDFFIIELNTTSTPLNSMKDLIHKYRKGTILMELYKGGSIVDRT